MSNRFLTGLILIGQILASGVALSATQDAEAGAIVDYLRVKTIEAERSVSPGIGGDGHGDDCGAFHFSRLQELAGQLSPALKAEIADVVRIASDGSVEPVTGPDAESFAEIQGFTSKVNPRFEVFLQLFDRKSNNKDLKALSLVLSTLDAARQTAADNGFLDPLDIFQADQAKYEVWVTDRPTFGNFRGLVTAGCLGFKFRIAGAGEFSRGNKLNPDHAGLCMGQADCKNGDCPTHIELFEWPMIEAADTLEILSSKLASAGTLKTATHEYFHTVHFGKYRGMKLFSAPRFDRGSIESPAVFFENIAGFQNFPQTENRKFSLFNFEGRIKTPLVACDTSLDPGCPADFLPDGKSGGPRPYRQSAFLLLLRQLKGTFFLRNVLNDYKDGPEPEASEPAVRLALEKNSLWNYINHRLESSGTNLFDFVNEFWAQALLQENTLLKLPSGRSVAGLNAADFPPVDAKITTLPASAKIGSKWAEALNPPPAIPVKKFQGGAWLASNRDWRNFPTVGPGDMGTAIFELGPVAGVNFSDSNNKRVNIQIVSTLDPGASGSIRRRPFVFSLVTFSRNKPPETFSSNSFDGEAVDVPVAMDGDFIRSLLAVTVVSLPGVDSETLIGFSDVAGGAVTEKSVTVNQGHAVFSFSGFTPGANFPDALPQGLTVFTPATNSQGRVDQYTLMEDGLAPFPYLTKPGQPVILHNTGPSPVQFDYRERSGVIDGKERRFYLTPGYNLIGNPFETPVNLMTTSVSLADGRTLPFGAAVQNGWLSPFLAQHRLPAGSSGYLLEESLMIEKNKAAWLLVNVPGLSLVFPAANE